MVIVFESFGFKYGVPSDADYVFDARFLPNPFWEEGLKTIQRARSTSTRVPWESTNCD